MEGLEELEIKMSDTDSYLEEKMITTYLLSTFYSMIILFPLSSSVITSSSIVSNIISIVGLSSITLVGGLLLYLFNIKTIQFINNWFLEYVEEELTDYEAANKEYFERNKKESIKVKLMYKTINTRQSIKDFIDKYTFVEAQY